MYTNFDDLYEKATSDTSLPFNKFCKIFKEHLTELQKEYPDLEFLSAVDQNILEHIELYGGKEPSFTHAAKIFLVQRARSIECMSNLLRYQALLKEDEVIENLEAIYETLQNQKHLPLSKEDQNIYKNALTHPEKASSALTHFQELYNTYLQHLTGKV
jgi:hypothetical protein